MYFLSIWLKILHSRTLALHWIWPLDFRLPLSLSFHLSLALTLTFKLWLILPLKSVDLTFRNDCFPNWLWSLDLRLTLSLTFRLRLALSYVRLQLVSILTIKMKNFKHFNYERLSTSTYTINFGLHFFYWLKITGAVLIWHT